MSQPIDTAVVQARLRAGLQHAGHTTYPHGVMQLCIKSNQCAYVVWYLGRALYSCSWYCGETGATVMGSYLQMLDYFCAQAGLPPLDSRQRLAQVESEAVAFVGRVITAVKREKP